MNSDKLMELMEQIDPKHIESAELHTNTTYSPKRNWKKYTLMAASFALVALVIFGFTFPSYARQIPIISGIFELFDRDGDINTAHMQNHTQEVNVSGVVGNMHITIQEAVFDGQTVYFTYMIESEEELDEWGMYFSISDFGLYVDNRNLVPGGGGGTGLGPLVQVSEHIYIGVGTIIFFTLPEDVKDGVVSFTVERYHDSNCWQVRFPVERVARKDTVMEDFYVGTNDFVAKITSAEISPLSTVIHYSYEILNMNYYGYISSYMIIYSGKREFPVAEFSIRVHDDLGNEYSLGGGMSEMPEYGRSGEGWKHFREPINEEAKTLTVTLYMLVSYWNLGGWQFDGTYPEYIDRDILAAGGSIDFSEVIIGKVTIYIDND